MIDKTIIRNKQFQHIKQNILEEREGFKLNLRKEKLDKMIFAKRAVELTKNTLEINPLLLRVDDSIVLNLPNTLKDRPNYLKPLMHSENPEIVKFAIYHSREILKIDDSSLLSEFISQGYIQIFSLILEKYNDSTNMVFESLWCLINLSSVSTLSLEYIKDSSSNLINTLVNLLSHNSLDIINHILWLLSNLIMDSDDIRIACINIDIVSKLLNLLKREINSEFIKHFTRLGALIVKAKTNVSEKQAEIITMILSNFYLTNCKEVLVNCYWGLSNLTELKFQKINMIIFDLELLDIVMKTRVYEIKDIKVPIAKIFGNLLPSLKDKDIKTLINNGLIKLFEIYLEDKKDFVKQVTLSGIYNLFSCQGPYVEYIKENTNILEMVITLCKHQNYNVKRSAFLTLNNCCIKMKYDSIIYLIGLGIFEIFIDNLKNRKESHVSALILESLDYIFEKGEILKEIQKYNSLIHTFDELGGIDVIKDLESHPNQSVYEESLKLLEKFNLID